MKHFYLFILIWLVPGSSLTGFSQVTINYDHKYQTIEGFGGFGPKEVWWSNTDQYYDSTYMDLIINDLGVNIIRTQLYWDFEPYNDNDDPNSINLSGFNFSSTSNNGKQFPFMTDLDTVPEMKQIATIWTPPVWMKLNVDNSLASFCNGQCGGYLNPDLYDEFAEYCVAYVKTVKYETGVDLYALNIQNELLFANPFESCVYTPEQYAAVLDVVGKRFKKEGLTTKIFGPEHMGSYSGNSPLFKAIFDDTDAGKYLDIYAVHGYQDGVNPTTGSATGWERMYDEVNSHGKELWMTETSGYSSSWDGAFDLAYSVMLALKYGKISAWVHWYLSGNIVVNNQPTRKFYALKSFYKYIRPGAVMIEANSEDTEVIPIAFRNDKKGMFTMVIMNTSSSSKSVSLNFDLPENMHFYRTSSGEYFKEVSPLNGNAIDLPSKSITTMVAYTENMAPTLETACKDTVVTADHGPVEIGISHITNGGDQVSTLGEVTIHFSNPSIIQTSSVERFEQNDSAVVRFTPDPSSFGMTGLVIEVNETTSAANGAFNAFSTRSVQVKTIPYINRPPEIDPVGPLTYAPSGRLQYVKLTGITDGNTNDGRETIKFALTSRQGLLVSRQVKYEQGSDTAQMIFAPKMAGKDTLDLFVSDDFGTDLGGVDQTHLVIPVSIEESDGIFPESGLVRVYPNPAGDFLKVISRANDILVAELYDITGRKVLSIQNDHGIKGSEFLVPLTNIGKGIYVLKVYLSDSGVVLRKIAVNK